MRVVVTGATGFVGRRVVALLRERGHEPIEWSRARGIDLTGPVPPVKADAVIHLVGIIMPHLDNTFERVHVRGTETMLGLGIRRFIHMSALGTRADARSEYHKTKWRAEEAVRASGLDYTIFRPSIVFGPDCAFIYQMFDLIHAPGVTPVAGSGRNLMQPIHVDDVARYFVDALERPDTVGQTYPLGGPKAFPFDEMLDVMTRARLGKLKPKLHAPLWAMWPAALAQDWLFERPTFTRDQLVMMREDNAAEDVPDFGWPRRGFETWCEEALRDYPRRAVTA